MDSQDYGLQPAVIELKTMLLKPHLGRWLSRLKTLFGQGTPPHSDWVPNFKFKQNHEVLRHSYLDVTVDLGVDSDFKLFCAPTIHA